MSLPLLKATFLKVDALMTTFQVDALTSTLQVDALTSTLQVDALTSTLQVDAPINPPQVDAPVASFQVGAVWTTLVTLDQYKLLALFALATPFEVEAPGTLRWQHSWQRIMPPKWTP